MNRSQYSCSKFESIGVKQKNLALNHQTRHIFALDSALYYLIDVRLQKAHVANCFFPILKTNFVTLLTFDQMCLKQDNKAHATKTSIRLTSQHVRGAKGR